MAKNGKIKSSVSIDLPEYFFILPLISNIIEGLKINNNRRISI